MASLYIDHISKTFPGVKALDNVGISILRGEIRANCGQNGARQPECCRDIYAN